jgi:mitogen-activated protein kinase 15
VVKLVDVLPPSNPANPRDIFLVYECMPTDLEKLRNMPDVDLGTAHVRWMTYRMLLGLRYCHSGLIVHRDLKPGAPRLWHTQ